MNWLKSFYPRKGTVYGGAAILLGLLPQPVTRTSQAEDPVRPLGERISEFSMTDVLLSRKAKDALQKDDQLAASPIFATVKNRIATLRGTVSSEEQARRATKLLRAIPGMASVDNECLINPVDSMPDEVAAAVKRAQGQPAEKADTTITGSPSALTGRSTVLDQSRPRLPFPGETISSKPPMPPPPTTVLFHPDLSAPTSELTSALEQVRSSRAEFRELRFDVKNGIVRVSGKVNRMSEANDFADRLTKLPGVHQVLLTKVEEK